MEVKLVTMRAALNVSLSVFPSILISMVCPSTVSAATSTHTYALPTSTKFPQFMIMAIKSDVKIPVILPSTITLDRQLPKGTSLAVDVDFSTQSYGIDLFERPKDSTISQYSNATLFGYIGTTTRTQVESYYGHDKSMFKYKKTAKLADGKAVVQYRTGDDNALGGQLITWHQGRWNYICSGYPAGDGYNTTKGMANQIAAFVDRHGLVVSGASRGYIHALALGNRPDFNVSWTYNSRQWYMVDLDSLDGTLKTAHSEYKVSS